MNRILTVLLLLVAISPNVYAQNLEDISFEVAPSSDWTNLFYRSSGWFGGDGIYTIPLNGIESQGSAAKKTLIIFSDTMIGEILGNKLQPNATMIHNSLAILDGNKPEQDKLNFLWKTEAGKPASIFIPKTPNTKLEDYYWLGDGFFNAEADNAIFIFGYRVKTTGNAAFGFEEVGNTLLKISADEAVPFQRYEQRDTPFFIDNGKDEKGSFGAGIFVNTKRAGATKPDGHVYIYGVVGKSKKLLVARVLPKHFEAYAKWRYWDGKGWVAEISKASAITDQVSNELSLSELPDGTYALIFQENGIGRNVCMRIGRRPFGPFGPVIKLWDTSADLEGKHFYSYNAKAHPSLSEKGELLISYNVNSFKFFEDLKTHPNLYRPRFIKVRFK
jgi:hypothetical protein